MSNGAELRDYVSLIHECAENQKRILELYEEVKRMQPDLRTVSDTVSRGKKGKKPIGVVKVESEYDHSNINRKKAVLYSRIARWHTHTATIADKIARIENIIAEVPDVDTRRILSFYCIDGAKTWTDVAARMGEGWTEEACRQRYSRFIRQTNNPYQE